MYKQLTREQRYGIYLGKQEGKSQTAIARQIGVSKSTVSRELKRNSGIRGHYNYERAIENTRIRRERSPGNRSIKPCVIKQALSLLRTEDWSPRQISGHLRKSGIMISHESIYSRIRSDESGELRSHCRHRMKYRRHVKVPRKTKVRSIPDRTSIHERPAEADGKWYATAPEEDLKEIAQQDPDFMKDWDPKYGDRMQKLVFIGQHLDKEQITKDLDFCLVSEE